MNRNLIAALLCLLLAPPAGAQTVKPQAKVEASQDAMLLSYRLLDRRLSAAQKSALEANQRIWQHERDAGCDGRSAAVRAQCLIDENEARGRLLEGEGRNGKSIGPRLQPTFFHEAKPGQYEIAVAYPQIASEHNLAEAAFDKIAHDLVLGDEALMHEYRRDDGKAVTHLVSYDIAYLGPRLVTIVFRHISTSGGLPHAFTARQTLVFDFSLARPLRLEDVLFEPARAVGPIAGLCKERLEKAAAREGWSLQSKVDFPSVINNFQAWAPGPFALEILFEAGTVAPETAGAHECRIDYVALLRWLSPGGPPPPKDTPFVETPDVQKSAANKPPTD